MRVLVTGGAGFIGSHLVRRLLEDGHQVRVYDNLSTGTLDNLAGLSVEVVDADLMATSDLAAATKGVEAVFHLAALPSVARSWADPVATLATNAHGTANVADAALSAGVGALIYSSSSSVYGNQGGADKTESMPPKPISPYGYSKFLGEAIALAYRQRRMRVVALRYFNVFGERQNASSPYSAVIPVFIRHALDGTPAVIYGDGQQSRDFTYVANVVEANLAALLSQSSGHALNVACGESRTLIDVVDAISELQGHPMAVSRAEARDGDIRHSKADVTLARAEIGFVPTVSFAAGLRRTYDYYRSLPSTQSPEMAGGA